MTDPCPSCASGATQPFYEARDLPVRDMFVVPTREEALRQPRGDVALEFCRDCGFIFNAAFDPSLLDYSACYEETQGFSPTFGAFARSLAQRLVERYGLRRKHILEIGCGKGEFLALLCELGDNRGTGFDPAFVPERAPAQAAGRMAVIREFYSEKHAGLRADFVCCRHTLEHIAEVGQFVRMLRRAVGGGTDATVFFEVPDVTRILREGAFWDVYYEHCSYFSPGSLARLLRASAFGVTELYRDYADQYLILTARPAAGPTQPVLPIEEDLGTLPGLVESYARTSTGRIGWWQRRLGKLAAQGARTILWGSGSKAVAFLTTLGIADEVACVVDVNPYRQGWFLPGTGHRIVAPESLAECRPDCVVVMNPVYRREIEEALGRLGVQPEVLTVDAPQAP